MVCRRRSHGNFAMRAVPFHDHHGARLGDVTAGPIDAPAVLAALDAAETEEGFDVDIVEYAGAEASLNACDRPARCRGKVVRAGLYVGPATIDAMLRAQKDIGVEARWCFQVQTWPRVVSMIAADLYPVEKGVTAEIAADNIVSEGFERLLDPAASHLRILVRV